MKNERVLNLFDAYADDLYRFAISYVGSKQEAEDIVQEVFLKLLSKKLFIGNSYEKSYLLKMTANLCKDYLKSKRTTTSVNYNETMKNVGIDPAFSDKEKQLYEMLMQLPDSQRIPIYLHFYEGYTYKEIAHSAEFITQIFHTADGSSIIYEKSDHEMRFTIEETDVNSTEVIDGKLYFVYDDTRIDVTDKCDENSYYRYEITKEDGGKSVILIGGTVTDSGWVELVFDKNGTYIFNKMNIRESASGSEPAWVNIAMHEEGVPCGDPVFDDKLDN